MKSNKQVNILALDDNNPVKVRYLKSLKETPGHILLSDIKYTVDHRGLCAFADAKGVKVTELTDEEKQCFIRKRNE